MTRHDARQGHQATATAVCPLSKLRTGRPAVIASTERAAEGSEAGERLLKRLDDLGFLPGATVVPVRRAPLHDPTVYRVADYEIALRARDAARILVNPLAEDAAAGTEPEGD